MNFKPPRMRFNTAGPCRPDWHYMVEPLGRIPDARRLIDNGDYFVLHAQRQIGKTTCISTLAETLTAEGTYAALYVTCEAAEAAGDNAVSAQRAILGELTLVAQRALPAELRPPAKVDGPDELLLRTTLAAWAAQCPRPLVLMLDEIDAVRGESLLSVLRQLRSAFRDRPQAAPWSIVLCGLRDVREYKAASGGDPTRLGTASPFNVKVRSLTLSRFTEPQVFGLLEQHTAVTGQRFLEAAKARVFELTRGQPWLVNALAREVVEEMAVTGDITVEHIDDAKERLILARATHLDSLVDKVNEPRVRRVLAPLLSSEDVPNDPVFDDDTRYVRDLGLVDERPLRIANPIYREIIPRVLSASSQHRVYADPKRFVNPDGSLDFELLMSDFQAFWIEHADAMVPGVGFREVGPQLVLMAFFQRLINGGGIIDREYAAGTRKLDLYIRYPYVDGSGTRVVQRFVLELKVWRDDRPDPLAEGLVQIDAYLAQLGLETGWLVLFDDRKGAPKAAERTREEAATTASGRAIRVLRA